MRLIFIASDKERERRIGAAFVEGCRNHGVDAALRIRDKTQIEPCDAVAMIGVKSRDLWNAHRDAGANVIMLDKGYVRTQDKRTREWKYCRVAINGHHPASELTVRNRPTDRLERLGLTLKPWRRFGHQIVIAGSSGKYHKFHDLPCPTSYAVNLVSQIKRYCDRPVIYRPKPSWREAVHIEGTTYSDGRESIEARLDGAHALVTHGSNACFEAVLNGIPCIVLGDAVAKPISSTAISEIENPVLASDRDRINWLANLAYCQWTREEFQSGEAWESIKTQIR